MLHDGALAIAPYVLLTLNALGMAALLALGVAKGGRTWQFVLFGLVLVLLAVYWALIGISAGPEPIWPRRQIADVLRWLALAAGVLWTLFIMFYMPLMFRRRSK
jgi:hypothetical protein